MKHNVKPILSLLFLLVSLNGLAQTLDKYFYSKGVTSLSQLAHPTNLYLSGTYDIYSASIDVWIKSQDKDSGKSIDTKLHIVTGIGDLYFSDIVVKSDTDYIDPFDALGLQMVVLQEIWKGLDNKSFIKMKQAFIDDFGSDIEQWNGKTWALLILNLDYYGYLTR